MWNPLLLDFINPIQSVDLFDRTSGAAAEFQCSWIPSLVTLLFSLSPIPTGLNLSRNASPTHHRQPAAQSNLPSLSRNPYNLTTPYPKPTPHAINPQIYRNPIPKSTPSENPNRTHLPIHLNPQPRPHPPSRSVKHPKSQNKPTPETKTHRPP
eukprot:TRINITY_DN57341_c0_g1_i1.p1 TRINITY_DN57341_c0_g1~~TRINITY_DN57341_c0_g1_i1.p1  ORF type:complete len:153 (+),score=1.73 TRINITY_DN57341_c0_g1_i1:183-641(+)